MATTTIIGNTQALLTTLSPLDWLLVVMTAWSVVRGFLHGAIRKLFAVLASVAALTTAYWRYPVVAGWLERWIGSAAERGALAFMLVAIAVFLAVVLLGRVLRTLAHTTGLGLIDRLAGAGLGFAQAALVGTIVITALSAFLPSHAWLEQSRLTPYFVAPARFLAQAAPAELERRIAAGLLGLTALGDSLR